MGNINLKHTNITCQKKLSQIHSSISPLEVSPEPSPRPSPPHSRKSSLPSKPKIPTQRFFPERWKDTLEWETASKDISLRSAQLPSGEETLLTASDTSQPLLAISCSRIPSREFSQNTIRTRTSVCSPPLKLHLDLLLVVLPTLLFTHSSMSELPSVLISALSRNTTVSLIASRRLLLRTVSSPSITVLVHHLLVLLFIEVSNSVCKIPSKLSTHIKKILLWLVSSQSSWLPRLLYPSQVSLLTHSILCKEDSKTRLPSQSPSKFIMVWLIATQRSWPKKEPKDSSRVLVLTF